MVRKVQMRVRVDETTAQDERPLNQWLDSYHKHQADPFGSFKIDYAIAVWFSAWTSILVRSRTFNASRILIVRSNVIPKYSFRSSRETWDSCTSRRRASSRW